MITKLKREKRGPRVDEIHAQLKKRQIDKRDIQTALNFGKKQTTETKQENRNWLRFAIFFKNFFFPIFPVLGRSGRIVCFKSTMMLQRCVPCFNCTTNIRKQRNSSSSSRRRSSELSSILRTAKCSAIDFTLNFKF